MGQYTILDDPRADEAVQEVLDKICAQVVSLLGDSLQAVVLAGGYGREEGGAYLVDGEYQLVNDLDLLVFVKHDLRQAHKRFDRALEQLSHRLLADARGLKEIDLQLTHVSRYRTLRLPNVERYELAHGHQVIYGHLELAQVLPRTEPSRLPVYEGANYFRNRGSGLLIPAIYFLTGSLGEPGKRKNFQIEMQKACQAMGDAALLMAGQYHYSYRERLRRFSRLTSDCLAIPHDLMQRVAPAYQWGVTRKLEPCFEWPGDAAIISTWFDVRDTFLDFFLWFESVRLRSVFRDWGEYAAHVMRRGAGEPAPLRLKSYLSSLVSLPSRLVRKADHASPLGRLRQGYRMMPLLLSSLTRDGAVRLPLLAQAARYAGRTGVELDLGLWKQLVGDYLWTAYPTGVVASALAPLAGPR